MKRLILIAGILVPISIFFFVITNNKTKREKAAAETVAASREQEEAKEEEKKFTVEITGENFEELVNGSDKPVVLDFWAGWCVPCMTLGPHLDEIAKDYEGTVVVGKIHTDQQPELAKKFQADQIPLVVIMNNGEIVKRMPGYETGKTPDEIRKQIDAVLNP